MEVEILELLARFRLGRCWTRHGHVEVVQGSTWPLRLPYYGRVHHSILLFNTMPIIETLDKHFIIKPSGK